MDYEYDDIVIREKIAHSATSHDLRSEIQVFLVIELEKSVSPMLEERRYYVAADGYGAYYFRRGDENSWTVAVGMESILCSHLKSLQE